MELKNVLDENEYPAGMKLSDEGGSRKNIHHIERLNCVYDGKSKQHIHAPFKLTGGQTDAERL
jgi:hypothetical protein